MPALAGSVAFAQTAPTELPPVVVPVPAAPPVADAPARRDPTGAITSIDGASQRRRRRSCARP